jgi:hypothetical protein
MFEDAARPTANPAALLTSQIRDLLGDVRKVKGQIWPRARETPQSFACSWVQA